jgi:photosystem II stability/assembly factor-like uncharacterized protein
MIRSMKGLTLVVGVAMVYAGAAEAAGVRDVSPELDVVLNNASEGFAFRGPRSLLVDAGRTGAHRSDNGGRSWRRVMRGLLDPVGVEPFVAGLCQAPSAHATVYVLGIALNNPIVSNAAYQTDDFGATWNERASIGNASPVDCAVDPVDRDVVYFLAVDPATRFTALFKSTDGARTFTAVGTGLEINDGATFVRVSPDDRSVVYVGDAGTLQGLYVSKDGGLTFARSPGAPDNPTHLDADGRLPGTVFISNDQGEFRSTDSGSTFTPVAGLPSGAHRIAFGAADPRTLYAAAGRDGLYRSDDAGNTWTRLAGPSADQLGGIGVLNAGVPQARAEDGDDEGTAAPIYVSTSLGPFRSDDGGASFTAIHHGYHATVNDLAFDAVGRLLVASFHTVDLFRGALPGRPEPYDNFGAVLAADPSANTDATTVAASPTDPSVVLAHIGATGNVYRTTDGGRSWSPSTGVTAFGSFVRMVVARSDASRVYLVHRGQGFFRSADGGASFRGTFRGRLGAVAVDPTNADVVYIATWDTGRGLFKSTDGGNTFTSLGQPGNFGSIAIDPGRPRTVYAGSRAGGVLRSSDGGATWTAVQKGLPGGEVLGVGVDPHATARIYAWVQAEGLFLSNEGGASWSAVDTGETARRSGVEAGRAALAVDPVVPGRVYLGNSGVLQVDTVNR